MKTDSRKTLRLLGSILLTLALIAAACGGDDDTDAADADNPTEPATPTDEPTAADDGGTDADGGEAPPEESDDATAADAGDETEQDGGSDAGDGDAPVEAAGPPVTVKIGVAYPDLEAFATLNKAFGIGDPAEQAEAVLDGWIRDGLLPSNVTVELVFGKYNIISDDDKLGVCTSLAQDDEVFAVIGGRDFTVGAECLASRFETPVIDTNSAPPSLYERAAPWFFTIRADQRKQLRSFVQWAADGGYLDDKTIGLFYETRLDEAIPAMKQDLEARGFEIASEISTSGEGIGSSEDQISVQRFLADGVDLVLPFVGGSSAVNVYSFAESQNFRPTYLDLDYGEHTTDVAAKTNPVEQYEGTLAMTMTRAGEVAANGSPTPEAEACLANYERFSGVEVPRESAETGEYTNVLLTCDLMSVLLAGLTAAAGDLTRENFVAGIENAGDFTFAGHGNGGFSPDDRSGVDEYRSIQWDSACPCWTAVGDFEPMVDD